MEHHLPTLPVATAYDRYKIIRDEIVHEDGLIGTRLSWFTASQAFLLSALAIAQGSRSGLPNARGNYFFPMVPIMALVSNVLIFVGVCAGLVALQRWRQLLQEGGDDFMRFPKIERDGWLIRLGWAAPIGLPAVFLVAWLYILIAGLTANFPVPQHP